MRFLKAVFLSAGFFLAVPAALAEAVTPPADFKAFSIALMYEDSDSDRQPHPLMLVSDGSGSTEFFIPGLDVLEAVSGGSFGSNDIYSLTLGFVPRAGYRVTRFQLSGTLTAEMERGMPGPGAFNIRGGYAANNSAFGIGRPAQVKISNLHGVETFEISVPVSVNVGPWSPVAEFEIWATVHADGAYTRYDYYDEYGRLQEHKVGPVSNVAASDVRFTVYWEIVPVPEPASWAMLITGLMVFPAAAALQAHRRSPARASTFLP
jgi:hypothetical protein